jgi:hypothetical protein
MRTGVCGCIYMLYVILVNTCRVDQLIFTVQCELSKLQINLVKIFHFFCKKQQNRFVSRLTSGLERFFAGFSPVFAGKPIQIQIDLNWSNRSVFTGFYRFTVGKPLPVGGGFCIQNGFVNRGWHQSYGYRLVSSHFYEYVHLQLCMVWLGLQMRWV